MLTGESIKEAIARACLVGRADAAKMGGLDGPDAASTAARTAWVVLMVQLQWLVTGTVEPGNGDFPLPYKIVERGKVA